MRKVFREKITGTTADRPQLAALMKKLAPGDVVIAPAVDRLSRDTTDLLGNRARHTARRSGRDAAQRRAQLQRQPEHDFAAIVTEVNPHNLPPTGDMTGTHCPTIYMAQFPVEGRVVRNLELAITSRVSPELRNLDARRNKQKASCR
jgi:hypothetical protein